MGDTVSYGEGSFILMFSIWVGGPPPKRDLAIMAENQSRFGLTLLAEENWIDSPSFQPLVPLLNECKRDETCAKLLGLWDDPRNVSDALRLWWLCRHPEDTYIDSDCQLLAAINRSSCVQVPSSQDDLVRLTAAFGGVPDMSRVRNSIRHFVEVFLIVGGGEENFFRRWLSLWASKYAHPGGIAETIIYENFELSAIPRSSYEHISARSRDFVMR